MSRLTKSAKALDKKGLTDTPENPLHTSLHIESENSQNQPDSYPPELQEIINRWGDLLEHIKAAIQALVKSFSKETE